MKGSFYGWYLKCQSDTQTLAVIPAIHRTGRKQTCSIQIITEEKAWTVTFLADKFRQTKSGIFIGENQFGEKGIRLAIKTPKLEIYGKLNFGTLCPLKYDIMGPFAFAGVGILGRGSGQILSGKVYLDAMLFFRRLFNAFNSGHSNGRHSFYRNYRSGIMAWERI